MHNHILSQKPWLPLDDTSQSSLQCTVGFFTYSSHSYLDHLYSFESRLYFTTLTGVQGSCLNIFDLFIISFVVEIKLFMNVLSLILKK